jgi:hypothetical protein
MIVGDSGMADASLAIAALYQKLGTTTFVNVAFGGWGLTTVPTGWQQAWPGVIAGNRPQLILAMLGGWDFAYIQAHGDQAYLAVLDDATKVLTAAGGRILWLGVPPPDKVGTTGRIDRLLQTSASEHPGVTAYADSADALRGPYGNAPRWLPDARGHLVLARKPDGWHFCPDGAVLLAQFVGTVVARLGWAPAPVSGWEGGTWRSDHRYDDPPGRGVCNPTLPQNAPP